MSTRAHPVYNDAPAPTERKLRLYVTDWNPRCVQAYRNIKKICQEYIGNKCDIEVLDLLEEPEVARRDQIVAIPTLVKIKPKPERIMVGDFSNVEQVLRGLGLAPEAHAESR